MTITAYQRFLDEHVQKGTALGLQGVVFDKDGIVFAGASGDRLMASADGATKAEPMTVDTVHWLASCTKITISIIALRLLDKNEHGVSLGDLDSHEALIKVLPEFDHAKKHIVTQIITGFEDKLNEQGQRIPILKPSQNKVTLRQLLTHSAGLAYYWDHPLMKEWYRPSDDSTPHGILAFASGRIADFEVPLVTEGGQNYEYSPVTDWLGQFIIRLTKKNLRQVYLEQIVGPLQLPKDKTDMMLKHLFKDPSNFGQEDRASFYVRLPPAEDASGEGALAPKYMHIPLPLYEPETDEPAPGMAHFASANIHANLPTYARILQAALSHDQRLLSESAWKEAEGDNLAPKGIKMPLPNMTTHMPDLTNPIHHYFDVDQPSDAQSNGNGNHSSDSSVDTTSSINLLQAHVALTETKSGLSAGAYSWAGLANTYWFIDPVKGVGAIFGTQLLPFYDAQMIEARYEWEKLVTSSAGSK